MSETSEHLVDRLLQEGKKTLAYFQALPAQAWERQVYTEGACWTVRQVLAHFVAAERSLSRLIMNILQEGGGVPQDFDLDTYNERQVSKLEGASPNELMAQFAVLRQETANLVRSMQPADLERTGRHPYLGIASLENIIKLIYRHNGIHLREMRLRIVERGGQD